MDQVTLRLRVEAIQEKIEDAVLTAKESNGYRKLYNHLAPRVEGREFTEYDLIPVCQRCDGRGYILWDHGEANGCEYCGGDGARPEPDPEDV